MNGTIASRSEDPGFRSFIAAVAFGLLVLVYGGDTRAANACVAYPPTMDLVTGPKNIVVRPDAKKGDLVSLWLYSPRRLYWTCNLDSAGGTGVGTLAEPPDRQPDSLNGATIYKTGVPGIGMAVKVQVADGCSAWWPEPGVVPVRDGTWCPASGAKETRYMGIGFHVAFVKTEDVVAAGDTRNAVFRMEAIVDGRSVNQWVVVTVPSVSIRTPPCTTPDVLVDMGTQRVQSFTGIGSTMPAKNFVLNFNNCPSGLLAVKYRFDPAPNTALVSPGTVPLAGGAGSASGVGIRVMDGNGNPIVFQKEYLLTSYSRTGTQQSYTVPMQAAYIQTDSVVKAGTVAAQVTFTLTYD